ncbi:MAG: heme-binding protein [Chloroflexi bacterium]|nr:heme-binding protein [Chloroflexota bacterium]
MVDLTLEMAEKALKGAQAKARELGAPMAVAVIDEGGNLVLLAKQDGAGFLTPDIARAKAFAAAAFRRPTKVMAENYQSNPLFWSSLAAVQPGRLLPGTGAVPILRGGRIIGAIGCSGGTGEQDHVCAEAGAVAMGG